MFDDNKYLVRAKIFDFFGQVLEVYNSKGEPTLYVKQKAFKLREDIRVYSDSTKTQEIFSLQARNIIDFSATYDVIDSTTGKKIGAFRRKGWNSLIRDEWQILDQNDNQIGHIHEDSMALALIRRFVLGLIPQSFSVFIGENEVADYQQQFNPFVYKLDVVFKEEKFDRRLGLAGAMLIGLIEGRQQNYE